MRRARRWSWPRPRRKKESPSSPRRGRRRRRGRRLPPPHPHVPHLRLPPRRRGLRRHLRPPPRRPGLHRHRHRLPIPRHRHHRRPPIPHRLWRRLRMFRRQRLHHPRRRIPRHRLRRRQRRLRRRSPRPRQAPRQPCSLSREWRQLPFRLRPEAPSNLALRRPRLRRLNPRRPRVRLRRQAVSDSLRHRRTLLPQPAAGRPRCRREARPWRIARRRRSQHRSRRPLRRR
jgi:hypothetical protein